MTTKEKMHYYETYLSEDGLKDYLRKIRTVTPATKEENDMLFQRYLKGEPGIKDLMIEKNLALVVSIAMRVNRKLHSYKKIDLIQEGEIGLMLAIETFDPTLGSFSTWATTKIKQVMQREIENKDSTIRRSVYFLSKKRKVLNFLAECKKTGEPTPSDEVLKVAFDLTDDLLNRIKMDELLDTTSLSTPLDDDDNSDTLEDVTGNCDQRYEEINDRLADRSLLAFLKTTLTKRDYYVLYARVFKSPKVGLKEIAQIFGVTEEAIRQHEEKLLRKMKKIYSKTGSFITAIDPKIRRLIDLEVFNVEPVKPEDVIKFLFVRDFLSEKEKELYHEIHFGELEYIPKIIARKLGIKESQLDVLERQLSEKIRFILTDKSSLFKSFSQNILSEFKTAIIDVDLDMDIKRFLKDYNSTHGEWKDKTFEEALSYIHSLGITLPPDLKEKLAEYFNAVEVQPIEKANLEKKINCLEAGFYKRDDLPPHKLYSFFEENLYEFEDRQIEALNFIFGRQSKRELMKKYPDMNVSSMSEFSYLKLLSLFFGLPSLKSDVITKSEYIEARDDCLAKLSAEEIKILDLYFGVYEPQMTSTHLRDYFGMSKDEFNDTLDTLKRKVRSIYLGLSNKIDIDLQVYRDYLQNNDVDLEGAANTLLDLYLFQNKSYEEIKKITGLSAKKLSTNLNGALRRLDERRFGLVWEKNPATNKDVELTTNDIREAIEEFEPANVLSVRARRVLSLLYGFTNRYNEQGLKCTLTEISQLLDIPYSKCLRDKTSGISNIKDKKGHIKKNTLDYIDRNEALRLLEDVHAPISSKERTILELFYKEERTIDEISFAIGDIVASITFALRKAVVTLKRYENGELNGIIHYETDVEPYLRFFSKRDRQYLIDIFKNEMSLESVAKKYGLTNSKMNAINIKLKMRLKKLQKGMRALDFDYFYDKVTYDDVPYYGDKTLALELFDLYHEKGLSYEEIATMYHPELGETTIAKSISLIGIALMKHQMGIIKSRDFSYDEVRAYYLAHQSEMSVSHKTIYYNYFESIKKVTVPMKRRTPLLIANDILKGREDYIVLGVTPNDRIKSLLRKQRDNLTYNELQNILKYAGINSQEFMKGSDKKQVLKFLFECGQPSQKKLILASQKKDD